MFTGAAGLLVSGLLAGLKEPGEIRALGSYVADQIAGVGGAERGAGRGKADLGLVEVENVD